MAKNYKNCATSYFSNDLDEVAGDFFNGNGNVRVKSVYDKIQCKQSLSCDLLDIDYSQIQAEINKRTCEDIRPIAFHVHHSAKFKHPVNTLPIQRKVLDVANME